VGPTTTLSPTKAALAIRPVCLESSEMTYAWTTWLAAGPCPATTDSGWLTEPKATVAAAIVAVVGALIAYAGVTKTTRTAQRESRRAERVAVLTEVYAAVEELARAVERVAEPKDPTVRADRVKAMEAGRMGELGDKYAFAATKLSLYGFATVAKTTHTLNDALHAIWTDLRNDPAKVVNEDESEQAYKAAVAAIQKALQES
jgi:hypothetical protein